MEITQQIVHELEPDQATKTKRDCVCSDCYGELIVRYDAKTRKSRVTCGTAECPGNGFVTRSWVERAKAENRAQSAEARQVLSKALPWIAPRKSEQQLLAELGG